MNSRKRLAQACALFAFVFGALSLSSQAHQTQKDPERFWVQFAAKNADDRTLIANSGVSIEFLRTGSVWGIADAGSIARAKQNGAKLLLQSKLKDVRTDHLGIFDFPTRDSRFHNFKELTAALKKLEKDHPGEAKIHVIGKSVEGRNLYAIQINSDSQSLKDGLSSRPGIVFTGTHHAREHLSTEVPLMLAQHILKNKQKADIKKLIDSRDIWIIPMVNPDGVEHDIASGSYKYWRKNRKSVSFFGKGVDLSRNYEFKWGGPGSSNFAASDTYRGPSPFSEPESKAIRDFVEDRSNLKIFLSFHCFSELILYPWGHTKTDIGSNRDLAVHEKLAKTMAKWNGYKPMQASDLYVASGTELDWTYGSQGLVSFVVELSPASQAAGGFYPGAGIIDSTFNANIKPSLYLIDLADDPYRALNNSPTGFLTNYVAPRMNPDLEHKVHPY